MEIVSPIEFFLKRSANSFLSYAVVVLRIETKKVFRGGLHSWGADSLCDGKAIANMNARGRLTFNRVFSLRHEVFQAGVNFGFSRIIVK